MELTTDLRIRTTLVCGALALAIAVSALLRGRGPRRVHWLFAAFSADIGFWYLSQTLYGFVQAPIWARLRLLLAVLLPVLACNVFEAMVPGEDGRRSRMGRASILLGAPMLALVLSPHFERVPARIALFVYCVTLIAAGLYELGQRGLVSRSRAVQRRVRFLVVIGSLAGSFSVADFAWVLGYAAAYEPPPVGVVLSIVFLFVLAQALRHERLLDLYEMVGRLIVATAVAFVIAGVFYLLVAVVGQFNTMWLNAIMAAIVVLVMLNPLREWVERQIQRVVLVDRRRFVATIAEARRRLAHTLEVDEASRVVMHGLERSRAVTHAGLYLLAEDGSLLERVGAWGPDVPAHLDVAASTPLIDEVGDGPIDLEALERNLERAAAGGAAAGQPAVLTAAELLGPLRRSVVLPIRVEAGDVVGLLMVADDRIRDAYSPEDVGTLDGLAQQLAVVVENSRVYSRMKDRDRLAVLGQMAAGLAHEIRNPLGAIKGAAQLLADPGPSGDPIDESSKEFLGIILEEVDRLDGVVGSVLDLARQESDVVAPIDVNAVVRRTLQVLAAERGADDDAVVIDLAEDLPRASISPEEFKQVIMNLVRNALQATRGRGRVEVRTASVRRGAQQRVEVAVVDDGPGIAPESVDRIFLPFYTTKDDGTGLGLAICQRIVQSAGGHIEVSSRPDHGSTFRVLLPVAMEALGTPTPATAAAVASAATT